MQAEIDAILAATVASGDLPHAAAIVTDGQGVLYEGQAGPRRLGDDRPLAPDTVFWIHSMTKPLTATGVMQLVEQGRIGLDDDCGALLPALAAPRVLEGWDAGGAPILRPAVGAITLRRLLTHTSGFCYDIWNAGQRDWLKRAGIRRDDIFDDPADCPPLGFDPGARWEYGIGIDWAGKALEALTGDTLEAYLRKHVLAPLGMTSTGFAPTPEVLDRLAGVHQRQEDGRIEAVEFTPPLNPDPAGFTGGGGMFGSARDYARFMRMMLNGGALDGVRVLKPETVSSMGENHIGDIEVVGLRPALPRMSNAFDFFPGTPKRWGLSFMINMADLEGRRRAGSLAWAGLRNTYFWIDPRSGIGGAVFTQMLPFADRKALAFYDSVERAVYAAIGTA